MNENRDRGLKEKLAEKILDFFGIELQVMPVSHLVWSTAAEDGDRAALIYDFSEEGIEEGETKKKLESGSVVFDGCGILQESSLFAEKAGDEKLLFLESLGMLREVRHGLNWRSLEPKRVVANPFFGCKSWEEVAVRLDLLEDKEEKKKRRRIRRRRQREDESTDMGIGSSDCVLLAERQLTEEEEKAEDDKVRERLQEAS